MKPLTERWYSRLKPNDYTNYALFNYIPRSQVINYFLVYSLDEEGKRSYAVFRSSTEFYIYYLTVEDPEIHEIILGEMKQKCRFDIDLTPDKISEGIDLFDFGDQVREAILDSMSEVLLEYNVKLDIAKNIVYCTSHSKTKYSAHLILADYYHNNYQEALTLFDQIINKSELLQLCVKEGIIDRSIYSTNHSMRLLGSYKEGSRVKSLVKEIIHHDNVIQFIDPVVKIDVNLVKFRRSCITDCIGCKYLPVVVPIKEKHVTSNILLPAGYEDRILELLYQYEGGKEVYEIRDVNGSLIDLKRNHPSYCKICKRVHDKIDPFLRITEGGVVNYYCRQSNRSDVAGQTRYGHKLIGLIKVEVKSDKDETNESSEINTIVKKSSPTTSNKTPAKTMDKTSAKSDKLSNTASDSSFSEDDIVYSGCDFDLLRSMSRRSFKV